MPVRKCYLLTCDESSSRSQFCKQVLEKIGFTVFFFQAIKNDDKVLSNKESMIKIYDTISEGDDEWVYVFEDDINILEEISLNEIIQYESISSMFFYLGLCEYGNEKRETHGVKINNKPVTIVSGCVRGLHAIGLSKKGAFELSNFGKSSSERYMDVLLEEFSKKYPANVVRYDLQSYIYGHKGILFQDRNKFPSNIGT